MTEWDTHAWDTRIARVARTEWRAFAAKHPAFARKLRKMTDAELDHLEASLLEQQITYLRRLPNFDKDTAAQSQVATYEYTLRLNREIAAYRAHPVKRSIPRRPFNPNAEPAPRPLAAPAQVNAPAAAARPSPPKAKPVAQAKLAPVADNVIAFRPWGKAFHNGVELGMAGRPNDRDVW